MRSWPRTLLDLIDQHTLAIARLTARIEEAMEPFLAFRELICSIPGIGTRTADVIIAGNHSGVSRHAG